MSMEIKGEKQMKRCKNTQMSKKELNILIGTIMLLLATTAGCTTEVKAQSVVEPVTVSQGAPNATTAATPEETAEYHGYSCGRPSCANHHHDSESQRQKAIIFKKQQINHNIFTVFGGALFLWAAVGVFSFIGNRELRKAR